MLRNDISRILISLLCCDVTEHYTHFTKEATEKIMSTVLHFVGHPSGGKKNNNSLAATVLIKDLYFSFQ